MDLATMRTRFRQCCAELDPDLTSSEIDTYLNEQYGFAIPDEIPGSISEGEWTEVTVASTQDYDFPNYVANVQRGATIDDNPLTMYFRSAEMWAKYDRSLVTESKPYAALFHNDTMTLYPIPDAAYTVVVPLRAYPNDGTSVLTLGDAGLVNESHALAVVWGAAAELTAVLGDYETSTSLQARSNLYMSRLRTRSVAPPKGRRARASF
jgi:hypothetical protein